MADCTDLNCPDPGSPCNVIQRVNDTDNSLKVGDIFPNGSFEYYAAEKESYLGSLCERNDNNVIWCFWKIMVKNGNLNASEGKCPENGRKVERVNKTLWGVKYPCFGEGFMNQPLMYRNASMLVGGINNSSLRGLFYGTYDVINATLVSSNAIAIGPNNSYFEVSWQKTNTTANKNRSWNVSFTLKTSPNYPWLKLLLRADATGYPLDGCGIMKALGLGF